MNELIKLKDFSNLSKLDLQVQGEALAKDMIDAGFHDSIVLTVQARKASEFLTSFVKALDSTSRDEVAQYNNEVEIYGAKLSLGSTGDRLDLEKDAEYLRLKNELANRAKWLKIASKDDGEVVVDGAIVNPVPVKTASKEILKIRL